MNLTIETNFKKGKKTVNTLSILLNLDDVSKIVKTKGLEAANAAMDKFVEKFTKDFKKTLSASINQ